MWEGVGDGTELQHTDPHSIGHNHVYFLFSWAAQPGAWGPSLSGTCSSIQHLLSNSSDPQLLNRGSQWPLLLSADFSLPHLISNWLNFLCTELYNSSTHTFFLWVSQFRTHSTARSGRRSIYNTYTKRPHFKRKFRFLKCPVGWGCWIHRLLLCRGVRTPPPQRVSWLWH